jgi:hypothetical protein
MYLVVPGDRVRNGAERYTADGIIATLFSAMATPSAREAMMYGVAFDRIFFRGTCNWRAWEVNIGVDYS